MEAVDAETAVVLGAGFAAAAGIPLQRDLSDLLLSPEFTAPIDKAITQAIKEFLANAFYWNDGDPIPTLEDIFTSIDLSAASGHHLGRKFPPKMLRALRRMLIYRVFSVLDRRFVFNDDISAFLTRLLPRVGSTTHFVVLNWDIVLERHLEQFPWLRVDYGVQATPWERGPAKAGTRVVVAKVHGSSNWVYCDNCRSLFYNLAHKLSLSVKAGLVKADFRLFNEGFSGTRFRDAVRISAEDRGCRLCGCAVGPHIATFSYKKSFRTHAFSSTWLAAESTLSSATKWIFVGYSLPVADYEFKHLLKTCQLKLAKGKTPQKLIDAVVLNDAAAERNFKSFFGPRAVTVYQHGLASYNTRMT